MPRLWRANNINTDGVRIDQRRYRRRVRERQTRRANAAFDGRIDVETVAQRGDKGADQTVAGAWTTKDDSNGAPRRQTW